MKIRVIDENTFEMKDIIIEDREEIVIEPSLTEKEKEKAEIIKVIADVYKQALPCDPNEFAQKYKTYKTAKAEFDAIFEPFKTNLIEVYKTNTDLPKSVVVCGIKATYVSPNTRTSIDSKKLKEEEPELAKKFTKTSNVSASIRLEEV